MPPVPAYRQQLTIRDSLPVPGGFVTAPLIFHVVEHLSETYLPVIRSSPSRRLFAFFFIHFSRKFKRKLTANMAAVVKTASQMSRNETVMPIAAVARIEAEVVNPSMSLSILDMSILTVALDRVYPPSELGLIPIGCFLSN